MEFPAIAPAGTDGRPAPPPQRTMGYSCQACARRKVKCDKAVPQCGACRKSSAECAYEAPPPRGGKRLVTKDLLDKLARYERLLRQHGLLDGGAPACAETPRDVASGTSKEPIAIHWNATVGQDGGSVIAGEGKSRYVDGSFWRNIGVGEDELGSDDEDENAADSQVAIQLQSLAVSDPLSDALMGTRQTLGQYHPTANAAMILWRTYVENIEPITKILHVPSTSTVIERIARDPESANSQEECLAFSVYHFAVFSMTNQECIQQLGQSRSELLSSLHFATRQALVNASFLKTTDLVVLQAFVLFLLPSRYTYDAHTHWILTGAAFRIGQRIGLHRDGTKISLAPFETEMRRRLFYPLLSLDGIASQLAGSAMPQLPSTWDVEQPLNVNDDQIWPGMTEIPIEQNGATGMMFRLSRTCIGKAFVKTGKLQGGGLGGQFDQATEAVKAIQEAEREVEEKYLRYCDVINPLHFLSMALARTGILAMKQRLYLTKLSNKTATDADKKETLQLAFRILDTDHAVCTQAGTSKFRWHTQSFFLWGMWDSLTFVLNGLWKERGIFSAADIESAWTKMGQVYQNHDEMLYSKQTINVAFRKLTLVAWEAHQKQDGVQGAEPMFVAALRELRQNRRQKRQKRAALLAAANNAGGSLDTDMLNWPSDASSSASPFDFNIDDADWAFWDGLIRGGGQ